MESAQETGDGIVHMAHRAYTLQDGMPYCSECYEKEFGLKCDQCQCLIKGQYAKVGDRTLCVKCAKDF